MDTVSPQLVSIHRFPYYGELRTWENPAADPEANLFAELEDTVVPV